MGKVPRRKRRFPAGRGGAWEQRGLGTAFRGLGVRRDGGCVGTGVVRRDGAGVEGRLRAL